MGAPTLSCSPSAVTHRKIIRPPIGARNSSIRLTTIKVGEHSLLLPLEEQAFPITAKSTCPTGIHSARMREIGSLHGSYDAQ